MEKSIKELGKGVCNISSKEVSKRDCMTVCKKTSKALCKNASKKLATIRAGSIQRYHRTCAEGMKNVARNYSKRT